MVWPSYLRAVDKYNCQIQNMQVNLALCSAGYCAAREVFIFPSLISCYIPVPGKHSVSTNTMAPQSPQGICSRTHTHPRISNSTDDETCWGEGVQHCNFLSGGCTHSSRGCLCLPHSSKCDQKLLA